MLHSELRKTGVEFVIVGGSAVELNSFGKYLSGDIDIVSPASSEIGETLTKHGFVRKGKDWVSEKLGLFIEIPGRALAGDMRRVREMAVGEGLSIRVIGIEDLILDRLNSCVHWRYETDCEWTAYLIEKYRYEIDFAYLREKAKEEQVDKKLASIMKTLGS